MHHHSWGETFCPAFGRASFSFKKHIILLLPFIVLDLREYIVTSRNSSHWMKSGSFRWTLDCPFCKQLLTERIIDYLRYQHATRNIQLIISSKKIVAHSYGRAFSLNDLEIQINMPRSLKFKNCVCTVAV
jgi:hypothetical protein